MITMPKTGEHVKFKTDEWKTKLLFIIYADFESILLQEDNGKQIEMILMPTNIKDKLLAFMVMN